MAFQLSPRAQCEGPPTYRDLISFLTKDRTSSFHSWFSPKEDKALQVSKYYSVAAS